METKDREEQKICGKCVKEEFRLDKVPHPHFPPGALTAKCSNCGEVGFVAKRGGFRRTYQAQKVGIYSEKKSRGAIEK